MKWAPQLRLRTIFLLIFCAAVGLTAAGAPVSAILPAIQTAMVIGLTQQARQLVRWTPSESNTDCDLLLARRFAIGWRIALAVLMAALLITEMLVAGRYVVLPERENILTLEPHTDGLPPLCMLVVLCNSLARWRSSVIDKPRVPNRAFFLWALAVLLTFFMLIEGRCVEFLVHKACANIEASSRPLFRRPN